MIFTRYSRLSRSKYTLILLIIQFFIFNITALAMPYHNGVSNAATNHMSDENLYSGIGIWIIIALVFSFLLNRYLHHNENKPEAVTKFKIPAPKTEVLKSNEVKTLVKPLIAEKILMN